MIRKLISVAKFVTRSDQPGWQLKVWPDDIFLVSYPKSGNTWLRFVAANLLQQDPPIGLKDADRIVPAVDGRSKRFFNAMKPPRVIKSHYTFHPAYKRVIYIVRDPRDVAVSQYHYQIKRGVLEKGASIDDFVSRFLAGDVCPYGSWGENVGTWLAARKNSPQFLLLRYEDMLADITSVATKVVRFLKLQEDPDRIALAVERSSLESMRKLEKAEGKEWGSTKGTRQEISFFRSAKTGEGRTALSLESIKRIEAAWGPLMRSLNYTLSSEKEAPAPAPVGIS